MAADLHELLGKQGSGIIVFKDERRIQIWIYRGEGEGEGEWGEKIISCKESCARRRWPYRRALRPSPFLPHWQKRRLLGSPNIQCACSA